MKSVFADTGYWIALINRRDQDHARALEIGGALNEVRIVTSEMVLTEVLNGFSESGSHLRLLAAKTVMSLRTVPGAMIERQSPDLFAQALDLYAKRVDKEWSLTDCASFLIMEKHELDSALTADHHFEQAGFKALLR